MKQAIFKMLFVLYQLTIITTLKKIQLQFYTNFLASKKLFRCLICQNPMATKISVWTIDHHRTLWLVLSLVCLKRSSRYWKNKKIRLGSLLCTYDKTPCSITSSVEPGFQSTYPLIVLLFLDLIHLLHQLSHPQLQLRQLVFGSDFCIVVCMLTNLDVQVNTLYGKFKSKSRLNR